MFEGAFNSSKPCLKLILKFFEAESFGFEGCRLQVCCTYTDVVQLHNKLW